MGKDFVICPVCSITIRDSPSIDLISFTSELMSLDVCLISKGVKQFRQKAIIATILLPFETSIPTVHKFVTP